MSNCIPPVVLAPVSAAELLTTVGGTGPIYMRGGAVVPHVDSSLTYALNQPIVIPCPLSIG